MDHEARRAFAHNVALLRRIHGWSQQDLSRKTGKRVGQTTISYYERPDYPKEPTLDKMEAIADAFRLPLWRLLMPGQTEETLRDLGLNAVLSSYVRADPEGRHYLERVAEREATYHSSRPRNSDDPATNSG